MGCLSESIMSRMASFLLTLFGQIANRFSPVAYEAWHKVETLVTADGRLPTGVSEYDYETKRDLALAATRCELRRWLRRRAEANQRAG
jgi:hypothetical protein